MPKYLVRASYTTPGVKGLLRDGGSARRKATEEALNAINGKLEAFYFAFGEDDAFILMDVPDATSAAALALSVASTGTVDSSITVLITPEEIDEAVKKYVTYRPPGD